MANVDNPNGFYPTKQLGGNPGAIPIIQGDLASGQNLANGDGLIASSGFLQILLAASAEVFGVLAETKNASSAAATVQVYPALEGLIFNGQCSGTYTEASHRYAEVDMEGATTAMEVNEDASSTDVIKILELYKDPKNETGLNARVDFVWNKRAFTS